MTDEMIEKITHTHCCTRLCVHPERIVSHLVFLALSFASLSLQRRFFGQLYFTLRTFVSQPLFSLWRSVQFALLANAA